MAVKTDEYKPVKEFDDWYTVRQEDPRTGCYARFAIDPCAERIVRMYDKFKREMDSRTKDFWKLETLAANEVLTKKPDLPNVSSGELAGLVRRGARNIVQNTPNLEVICEFNDDSPEGILAKHMLLTKVVGSDNYSNDMQQHLFASTMSSFTFGFDCVIPVLLQDAVGSWFIDYDSIHYRDVFPENGAKDIRQAKQVFVRRYLSKADVHALIRNRTAGWDIAALKHIAQSNPPARKVESSTHSEKRSGQLAEGYEIVTYYTSSGDPFLTFDVRNKLLLRIEQNKHPMKQHPVHFLVLEKDNLQALGTSMVSMMVGRQEFQDLLLNGSMKMWYWGINPTLIGRGVNTTPNFGPGKYVSLSNPNAAVEPLEVSTSTLMQYGQISQQNQGAMINTLGAADQQMATQAGNGMSATPQGVNAQQEMVDITTNNYQKAVENFFSHYCSYALTIYFQELKSSAKIKPNAEARLALLASGIEPEQFAEDGTLKDITFDNLAIPYYVRCVPGSLVELEDDKQRRVLQELFVPLSQAMPAIANAQDQDMLKAATQTLQYILGKQIELSGARDAKSIQGIWKGDDVQVINERDARIESMETTLGGTTEAVEAELTESAGSIAQLQAQVSQLTENFTLLLDKLGVNNQQPGAEQAAPEQSAPQEQQPIA